MLCYWSLCSVLSVMNPPVPFRVCIPSRGARVGIATTGYRHLREVLRQKYAVSGEFSLQLDDGTEVCDEEYLKLLEPHTSLTVVEQELTRSAGGNLVALAGKEPNIGANLYRRIQLATRTVHAWITFRLSPFLVKH